MALPSLQQLARELASGRLRARELTEQCLGRIHDPAGEGARTFLKVFAEAARAQADGIDAMRAAGVALPRFAGIPVSVKDLFDVAGLVTTAGSHVLEQQPRAARDAVVVARLRAAGLIVIGRTNMTEFAFSGLGINPHFGTPLNPFDRATGRIPGGSSSGAAVSVTDGMAAAALGTDTGGSCRIPAALCGIVGFKPTARRVPREGVVPLSTTLDSVGPLAASVECCAVLDAVIAGETEEPPPAFPVRGLRLLQPAGLVMQDLDEHVGRCFERALGVLARGGALIERARLDPLERIPEVNAKGGFSAAESYWLYRGLLESRLAELDPRVGVRMLRGREHSAADYLQLLQDRAALCASLWTQAAGFDALVLPTVPVIAPAVRALAQEEPYFRVNALVLRNPALANFLDGCAISLPMHAPGEAPAGLMLMAAPGRDRALLGIARGVEAALGG